MFFRTIVFVVAITIIGLNTQATEPVGSGWIWYPEKAEPKTTRYFRKTITIDDNVKAAQFYFACDDFGKIYVNGNPVKNVTLKTTAIDLTERLKRGNNVIAVAMDNHSSVAGLICRGEIFTANGKKIEVVTDKSWLTAKTATPEWNNINFNDTDWKNAQFLGEAGMSPWGKMIDITFLLPLAEATKLSKFIPPAPDKKGRLMLDDFSDVSSWMGGPVRGQEPGSGIPFHFSLGSTPCPERNDGFSGLLEFNFIAPNGIVRFEKNAVFKTQTMPEAFEFDANAQGNEVYIWFEFADKREKPLFKSAKVKVSGDKWQRYRIEFNPQTVANYQNIMFPVSIRNLFLESAKPGKGSILIDDLVSISDISNPEKQLEIHQEYTTMVNQPGKPVMLGFRLRNGAAKPTDVSLTLNIYDNNNQKIFSRKDSGKIAAFELKKFQFDAGKYDRNGAYRIELIADNGNVKNNYMGWFGVFTPNEKRINQNPMWFGVEDQEIRNTRRETLLHLEWMKLLGVDMIRGGLVGSIESVRGSKIGFDGYEAMWKPHADAGLMIILDYAGGIPGWTYSDARKKQEPKWSSSIPDQSELLKEHMRHMGEFIAKNPQIKYFEWFNEPDLGSYFGTSGPGTVEEYVASLKLIYPILKTASPSLKVMTGGMVISHHPNAKNDFNRRIYQEAADYYDIAAYHGHDNFENYKRLCNQLGKWLEETHIAKPVGNTEAGLRSYHSSPELFWNQARELVQKITYTKTMNAEFYIWFMIQDYWDKYINADDSFGLVTVENQPKPSFVAYNELIRQLANTKPASTQELDPRLESYRFSTGTEDVFVCWPKFANNLFTFGLKTNVPITQIDICGNRNEINPVHGIAYINSYNLPFYLRTAANTIQPLSPLLNVIGNNIRTPGETTKLVAEIVNAYNEPILFTVNAQGEQSSGIIPMQGKYRIELTVPANDETSGVQNLPVAIVIKNQAQEIMFKGDASLPYWVALPVFPKGQQAKPIVMTSLNQLTELAFDPTTPRWSGPEDLSATINTTWDNRGLHFDCIVNDNDHAVPYNNEMNWRNDCLQLAFANDKREATEIAISGNSKNGATVWCHISADKKLIGKWNIPASVVREKSQTCYRFSIPFEKIGIIPTAGTIFRMSLLVSDNDQGKRLRIMQWNSGIENSKSPDFFGWAKLK